MIQRIIQIVIDLSNRYLYGAAIFVGLLLGSGFVISNIWWLYILGGLYFLWLITQIDSWICACWIGFLAWTTKSLLVLLWFWSAYPITWISDISAAMQMVLIFGYWFSSAVWLGLAGCFFTAFTYGAFKYIKRWWLWTVPVSWVLSEILGSFFFSVFTQGAATSVGIQFSFGYIGYLLAEHAIAFTLADFGGAYLLSVAAILLVILCRVVFTSLPLRYGFLFVVTIAFSGYTTTVDTFGQGELTAYKVAVVETYFDAEFTELFSSAERREILSEAVQVSLELQPDYILLPEDSRFTDGEQPGLQILQFLRQQLSDTPVRVIDSRREPFEDNAVLRAIVYDNQLVRTSRVDKQYLVPQGEYMPTLHSWALQLTGAGRYADKVEREQRYVPGPLSSQADFFTDDPIILFCFSSADPRAVRRVLQTRNNAAPFVAHPISHAWAHYPEQLFNQQDMMLRVQARWNNIPIISAGNMAPSQVYLPSGKQRNLIEYADNLYWRVLWIEV